jgi:hypothetical protein
MPRSAHATPKYRRHRPSGQAVVELNGKVFYLGPWKSKASLVEYDKLIGEWLVNGRCLPTAIDDEGPTVTDLMAAYWSFAEGYYVKDGEPTSMLNAIRVPLGFLTHGRHFSTELPRRAINPSAMEPRQFK